MLWILSLSSWAARITFEASRSSSPRPSARLNAVSSDWTFACIQSSRLSAIIANLMRVLLSRVSVTLSLALSAIRVARPAVMLFKLML